jgi:putative transposase
MNDKKTFTRVPPARFENWDYEMNTAFFVTICTKDRELLFGNVLKGKVQLSEMGILAEDFLKEIPKRYPYLLIDEIVVMPNHIHAIIMFKEKTKGMEKNEEIDQKSFQKKHKEMLSSIMGSYKSVVSKPAQAIFRKFGWQSGMHEQIIKDNSAHERIANYIINNSSNWRHDKFYKSNE